MEQTEKAGRTHEQQNNQISDSEEGKPLKGEQLSPTKSTVSHSVRGDKGRMQM